MKKALALAALLAGVAQGVAQTTVSVDSTLPWIGYMNVFDLGNVYQFGNPWGTADLDAYFTGTNTLTLTPNTSIDRDKAADPYWWVGGTNGAPNKIMDASMYVQDDTLAGQTITFSGTCLTNSLTSDYSVVAFIKDFAPDYSHNTPVTTPLAGGQPFTLTLDTAAGHHLQYGFETIGPDARIATVDALGKVVLAVNNADPSLSTLNSEILVEGQTAALSVVAKGTAPFTYQWISVSGSTTNPITDGGRISGASTGSLVISNLTSADAGDYFVTVSNAKGAATAHGSLSILPLSQVRTNLLLDPGFESGSFAITATAGWLNYNGAAFKTTNDFYANGGPNVAVVDGGGCFLAYSTGPGSYNGCYQVHPAKPGEAFAASAWFLTPSSDPITGAGSCWVEVKYFDAGGGLVGYYKSATIDANSPADTYIYLSATNQFATDYVTPLGSSPYTVAPPGTASAQFQITYHPDTGGSVYVDAADLREAAPPVTPSLKNGSFQLSFPTLYGPVYRVYAKNSLKDAAWQQVSTVNGDGSVKTVTDPLQAGGRFYWVNTQP